MATQYSGQCIECETKYARGMMVYYDKEHLNSKGNAIVCTNYSCFSEQGGKVDVKSSSARTTVEDLEFNIPDVGTNNNIISASLLVKQCLVQAHKITTELYPKLDPLSNTFGQIRNAFKTDLVNICIGTK